MIVRDPDVEDLAVGINAVSDQLAVDGYAERLLCAVFAFQDAAGAPIYFIYNYKRGTWYPFVPSGDRRPATTRPSAICGSARDGAELPLERDMDRWYPLWGIPV